MNPSSLKRPLKKISLVLLAVLAGLFVAELSLRIFAPQHYPVIPAAYDHDPETAYRLRPDAHMFRTTDHQQESISNRLGTANFQQGFDDYETLVFAVGDSYTQGTGLPADASYPAQLDLILNRDEQGFYVRKFGVVNLGVAGFGGEQSLLNLRRHGSRLRPPAVILYLGCDNDFEDDLSFGSGDRHRIVIAGSPFWGSLTRPLRLVFERTHVGLLARAAYRQRVRDRLVDEATGRLGRKPSVAELEASILERLKAYAEQNQSALVVSWSEETESYSWLKSWAAERGVAFADWAPKANSVRAAMPTLTLDNQHSGGHHRGWVNQLIAWEFARQIRARR
jgi:lysophospholipase L1-like esterase